MKFGAQVSIATRYDKLALNFLASVCLVAAIAWRA
jgi:hypothetical protein